MKSKNFFHYFKAGIVVIGVIIIPMLYSYFYLDAFWDPYNRLDTLPVAVVNQDKGAVINSESRNLGREMVTQLKDDGTLKWVETNENDANAGVESGKYYAAVTIPSAFSGDIATAQNANKVKGELYYRVNQKKNYVASQLLGKAVTVIQQQIDAKVSESITSQLTAKLNEVPGKLGDVRDGFGQISDGAQQLSDGGSTLYSGTKTVADNLNSLTGGLKTLSSGSASLTGGLNTLAGGAGSLSAGSKTLASSAGTLSGGLTQLKGGTTGLKQNMLLLDKGIGDALGGAQQLSDGASAITALNGGLTQLNTGATALAAQMKASATGTATLYDNVNALNTGTAQYVSNVDTTIAALRSDPTISSTIVSTLGAKLTYLKANNPGDTADITQLETLIALFSDPSDPQAAAVQAQFTGSGGQLTAGTAALLAQFADGSATNQTLKYAVDGIAAGAGQLAASEGKLTELQAGTASLEQALKQIKAGSSGLAAGATVLDTAAGQASDGAAKLAAGAASASGAAEQVSGGAELLASGAAQVQTGIGSAMSGSSKLADGAAALTDGAKQIADGAASLKTGADIGKNKVADSIADANSQLAATKGLASYAKDPVKVNEKNIYPVPNYGTSFAPYFLSLSLYVGALMMFFGIYLDPDEKIKVLSRNSDRRFLRVGAFVMLGAAQAVLLALILKYVLGLKVADLGGFFLCAILVSLVFISIVELLLVHFKDLGKFLAIAFLVLQLTSCAGVFPMETVPKFFNYLYPYMPMTYSVRLFKDVISGYSGTDLYQNVWVLIGIFAFFTVLTVLLSATRRATVMIRQKVQENANGEA